MKTYRDLITWQRARTLTAEVYLLTHHFPPDERFGLISQMRRASVSIISNIAEGYRRAHVAEWRQFVRQAFGSAAELESQLIVAQDVGFITNQDTYRSCVSLNDEVLRLLNGLIHSLEHKK